jgi:hypothetical protein
VTCLVLLAGSFAQAAQDPLRVIPEEALGFALVNRLAETDAKIQQLAKELELPVASPLRMFQAKAGLEGVLDEEGTAAIALVPGEDAGSQPVALMFLPVADYGQFVRKLNPDDASAKIVEARLGNQSFVIGNRGGYAVVAKRGNRHALETALDSSKRVAGLGSFRGMVAEGDVAAVVTRRGVEVLSDKGQEALQEAKEALAALPAERKQGMEAAIGVFDVYEQIIKALGEEIHSYAVAGSIDKGGNIHLLERVRVMPGRKAAKILSEVKPPRRDLLTGLPDGPFVFALAGVLPESAGECLMGFSADFMKAAPGIYGLNEDQVDELIDISRRSMKGLHGMSFMMGVGKPGDPIYGNIAVVEMVDDSKAFLADYRKTVEAMNRLLKDAQGSIMKPVKLKDVEIGDVSALKLTMKISMAPQAAEMPGYDEIMEKILGPGGKMIAFIAPADKKTIVAAYTSKKLLRECLKAADGSSPGLAGDPQVAKTAAMLPSGAQWVGYISPKGTIDFIKRVIPAVTPEGRTAPKLPEFPETPPIGFAVKTTRDGIRSHTVVPAAALKGIAGFVTEIRGLMASPGEVEVEAAEVPER